MRLQNTYSSIYATVIVSLFYFISNSFVPFFTIPAHLTCCLNVIPKHTLRIVTFIKYGSVNIFPLRAQNFKA
jgi:hypothetical protein